MGSENSKGTKAERITIQDCLSHSNKGMTRRSTTAGGRLKRESALSHFKHSPLFFFILVSSKVIKALLFLFLIETPGKSRSNLHFCIPTNFQQIRNRLAAEDHNFMSKRLKRSSRTVYDAAPSLQVSARHIRIRKYHCPSITHSSAQISHSLFWAYLALILLCSSIFQHYPKNIFSPDPGQDGVYCKVIVDLLAKYQMSEQEKNFQ